MGNRKGSKRAHPVTPRQRAQAREWKADLLTRLVNFSRDPAGRVKDLEARARYLLRYGPRQSTATPTSLDLDTCQWMQNKAARVINQLVSGQEWELTVADLTQAGGVLVAWYVGTGYATFQGGAKAVFLLALKDVLSDPANAGRLRRCAQPGCQAIFVKRKTGRFCDTHAANTFKVQRYRARLSAQQLSDKRHEDYLRTLEPKLRPHVQRKSIREN
jgi:hypothetical protein